MKTIKVELSNDLNYIEILPFADLHLGDPNCDMDYIQAQIDYVKENPYCYCLLNGDIMNNATKTSISDIYSETLKPMDQLTNAILLFEPIKDKILCITNGNHEMRTYRNDGIDLMGIFASQLGIFDKYAKESAFIFLSLGQDSRNRKLNDGTLRKEKYTIYVTHGSGGGRKEGAKAIRLADMASIVDADIYIHSHTHLPMIMKQAFYRVDKHNSFVALVDKLFVNTSSMLNYGGYGESYEFKPNSKDTPHIFISGKQKKMEAKL